VSLSPPSIFLCVAWSCTVVDKNDHTIGAIQVLKKKIWANFQRIIELFTQKIATKLSNMDLGSGIRKKPIPDPASRGQQGTGSRIRNTADKDPDPAFQAFLRESGSGYGIRIQGFDDQKLSFFDQKLHVTRYGNYP
jgi:hypothetical protein